MKVTKRQLNLIIENYLVSEVKMGTDRFTFENSCDMSDIEFTKGFKVMKEFQKDKNVQATSKKIREIEAAINNPAMTPGLSPDDFVSGKIAELEEQKEELVKLTNQKLGAFTGLSSPVFQAQLLQLLGFGMLVTMGPAANLYCDLLRSFVTVLNKSFDAAYGADQKKEEFETIEFDFFYNGLQRVASPVFRSLADSKQEDIWDAMLEELNISDNAKALFIYIYCVIAKKIQPTNPDLKESRSSSKYRDATKIEGRKLLGEIKRGEYKIDGKSTRNVTLKQDFVDMLNENLKRDKLIKSLVSFIDPGDEYKARGKITRSNLANLSQTIAEKSAEEKDFYDNLIGHIRGTLNSVPG
tara:strand:- start:3043 stop:4104 length:1062 start_codon:yes stop_codon:yes gene_type:complete